ncbi:hypothetical protein FEM48_Zijuj04G0144400 [Ziziphus jujuba var. spinosa]|uniref:Reverse transcriptase domain-containing protein n=1 Tax=Ziziphus jujuba var. spinosa TaxID=714518 RepID=A0A978VKE3_ZIZJJ|nr:hypothetical protein FEM48_Zijuj04G0144400 [Ziziphus jujuba var. spinosa]
MLVLIPKTKNASNLNQFRPISLCNFCYKIVTKILTARLRPLMSKIISPHQGAFLEGRWIAKNTVVGQEVAHKVRKHKGKNGLMLVKIDMKKAYDRLEWQFITKVVKLWGFSEDFRRMIFSCISSVEFDLLINGSKMDTVNPERGIRQGDPLSPFLFILCSEIFTRLMEKNSNIQGIKICKEAPAISHLLYADDILVACRANDQNVKGIQEVLRLYSRWSGQEPNSEKSQILFSRNIPARTKALIKEKLGFKDLKAGSMYLGNSLLLGKNRSKEFSKLKEKLQNTLEGWKSKVLSKAGKATLIKSVAQAGPVYTMSTFKIPNSLCNEMDTAIRRFWWGAKEGSKHYLALKSWNLLCQPKALGGLGFRKFKDFNLALLAKLGWKLAKGEESLWTQIIRAKYLRNKSFFGCKFKAGNSYVWKSLLCSKEIVRKGSCFKIGNRWGTNPWKDPWVPDIRDKTPKLIQGADESQVQRVAELLNPHTLSWDETKLQAMCDQDSIVAIKNVKCRGPNVEDKLCWTVNNETNKKLLESINASLRFYMTHTMIGGIYVLLCAIGATLTEESHIIMASMVVQQNANSI